jgi:pimeloyl-ACP methyl ester carboxylesterase
MENHFIKRAESFQTHYLEWRPKSESGKLPIICIHGLLSNARIYNWIGKEFSSDLAEYPRRVIAIDMRGCGESGMPEKGFTLEHMASDIEHVMERLGIEAAHFIAYSRGVPYALKFALRHPNRIHGLVIGDFASENPKLSEEWVQRAVNSFEEYHSWDHLYTVISANEELSKEDFEVRKEVFYAEREGKIRKRYEKELPARLQSESENSDLVEGLAKVKGPILVLKGAAEGSLLKEEQLKVFQLYHAEVMRVQGAGHDVFEPREQVRSTLRIYFKELD